MFSFNFINAIKLLVPPRIRSTKLLLWVQAFIQVIDDLFTSVKSFRSDELFMLQHNSQVMYLEHILNDRFNPYFTDPPQASLDGDEIYIDDGDDKNATIIYNKSESRTPPYIYNKSESGYDPVYIYNKGELSPLVGFIIWVPDTFTYDENEMKALVNKLKLAGSQYRIIEYTL